VGGSSSGIWSRIQDFFDAVRDLVVNLVSDFRESNRYFKIKAGLIGGYLTFSLAVVVVFVPPGELNEIDARLVMGEVEIIGGRFFKVVNEGAETWKNIEVTFNDRYRAEHLALRPGRKKAFYFKKFEDRSGQAPPEDIRVRKLRIDCSEGAFERDYTKRK